LFKLRLFTIVLKHRQAFRLRLYHGLYIHYLSWCVTRWYLYLQNFTSLTSLNSYGYNIGIDQAKPAQGNFRKVYEMSVIKRNKMY